MYAINKIVSIASMVFILGLTLLSESATAQLAVFGAGEAADAEDVNDNFAYLEDLVFALQADIEMLQAEVEENRDVFGRSYRVYTATRIVEGEEMEFVDTLTGATFVIGFDTDTIGMASITGVSHEKEIVLTNSIFNEGEGDEYEAAGSTSISDSSTEVLEGEEALLVPYEQDIETGIVTIEDISGSFSVSKMGDVLIGGIQDSETELLEAGLRVGVEVSQSLLPSP